MDVELSSLCSAGMRIDPSGQSPPNRNQSGECVDVTLPPPTVNKCNGGSPQNQPGTVQLPYKKTPAIGPTVTYISGGVRKYHISGVASL
jgi:hypothetical protein